MSDEPRETSGATTVLLLGHVRERGGDAAVAEMLRRADVPLTAAQLTDTATWISYATRIRLFAAATEVLGDPTTMRQVGRSAAVHGAHHALIVLLRGMGTPRAVYRVLHKAVPKFTTTSTMRVLTTTARSAQLDYRLHDGYEHSRLDCEYAQGLFEAVPTLFGLPLGHVLHDRCQSDGHPSCTYEVTWAPRRRLRAGERERDRAVEVRALRGQIEELQHAASDLVASSDVGQALDRIVERAAAAVLAPAYLLVVEPDEGGEPDVRSAGLTPERRDAIASDLLHGRPVGASVAVVDVASRRRRHGRLAVVYGPEHAPLVEDLGMLEAYAGHAAAALDLLSALEESRRHGERASALLALAEDLARADDETKVGEVAAGAVPGVVGSRSATVMLWDPGAGALTPVASGGLRSDQRRFLLGHHVRADESPEMAMLLTRRDPVVLRRSEVSVSLRPIFDGLEVETVVVAPLVAGSALLGVLTAGWTTVLEGRSLEEASSRVVAVSAQAATALEKARLLTTVRHQAMHDALSGLPNRVLFTRTLDETLRAAEPGSATAVLFCDLDRFKHVNDELGHAAGDELLRQVAARLRGVFRPGDLVGRLSGDEFAVVLAAVDEPSALAVASRVVESLDQPFRIEGRELRVTVSVGVALHTGTDGRGDRLLAAADAAMYDAKQAGRNQVALAGAVTSRLVVPSLEAELGRAVESGQLRLYFQPVVDIAGDGAPVVVGAEALLRWAHPRLGLLAPGAFLPLAEETGLVTDLDLWAVDAACAAVSAWPQDGRRLRVAVNLAGSTLVDDRLGATVRDALRRHGVSPDQLDLEVVESRSLVDLPGVVDHIAELRQMGLRIALDDFGTGFSTLAWLQALPVDQVKIDRSFVMRLPDDAASLAVVRGVVALAEEIGLDVVAEGVETAEQLAALRAAGCRHVQGYLLGRPAPLLDVVGPTRARTTPHDDHPVWEAAPDARPADGLAADAVTEPMPEV
ncbi:putative bifunctional diguanylate cyclase/phosphodiesterase [Cellulomonas carbonis]|uniref:Diguanylate phosphodiesterase n=1 Tax=Cellulomonas carbonis T26 TaxID=947969 RepID=A0A0A0BUA2_9CELL|nr:bifunctional diguanylate cyclase/phosphodiesterase [Cellulomonas carbonis]KGM11232.1 diguanylate phosphodiesterase [Cellulomonas carbonis T26]GGC10918.1 hypothetical protein GCM10010972_25350 [Cellulomonas carbonis]